MAVICGGRFTGFTVMVTVWLVLRGTPVPSPVAVAVKVTWNGPDWLYVGVHLNKSVSESKVAPAGRPLTVYVTVAGGPSPGVREPSALRVGGTKPGLSGSKARARNCIFWFCRTWKVVRFWNTGA